MIMMNMEVVKMRSMMTVEVKMIMTIIMIMIKKTEGLETFMIMRQGKNTFHEKETKKYNLCIGLLSRPNLNVCELQT